MRRWLPIAMAVAGVVVTCGGEMQDRPDAVSPAHVTATRPCTSDYQCSFGNVCVKEQFSMEGTCARAVNQYGNPTFQGPRPGSVGPGNSGNCGFDTDCPIGFKCMKGNAIRGNCMK